MPGQAVIVVSFPEPEHDMELASIIEVLQTAFAEREQPVKMHMGIRNVADRVIGIFSPLHESEENGETMVEKVPLVIYKDGKRIVIGEAEIDGDQVTATFTDEEMAHRIGVSDTSHFSIADEGLNDIDVARAKRRNVFDKDKD